MLSYCCTQSKTSFYEGSFEKVAKKKIGFCAKACTYLQLISRYYRVRTTLSVVSNLQIVYRETRRISNLQLISVKKTNAECYTY